MHFPRLSIECRGAVRSLLAFLGVLVAIGSALGQTVPRERQRPSYKNRISEEKLAEAKRFAALLKQARREKPYGVLLSKKDIHGIYPPNAVPGVFSLRARQLRAGVLPRHRPSVVSSPASLLGPVSLGPAYGVLMFQNSMNLWPDWRGGPLPWNGMNGARYLLSSGPLTIPYELALQNRVEMTTITDSYGNQLVMLKDIATGFSQQFGIVGRLDSVHAPGTGNPVYGSGYVISVYDGRILGTNTSSFRGVFVPASPYQTTFGYMGDLDTLGPYGRGNTPLNPPGPPPTVVPGVNDFSNPGGSTFP